MPERPFPSGPPPHSRRDRVLERLRAGPTTAQELAGPMRIPMPRAHVDSLSAEGHVISIDWDIPNRVTVLTLVKDAWAEDEPVRFPVTDTTTSTATA